MKVLIIAQCWGVFMFRKDKAFENLSSLIKRLECEPEKDHEIELTTKDGQKLIYVVRFSSKLKERLILLKNDEDED
jgi:hypothetical protein